MLKGQNGEVVGGWSPAPSRDGVMGAGVARTPGARAGSSHPPQKRRKGGRLRWSWERPRKSACSGSWPRRIRGPPALEDPGWNLHQHLQTPPGAPLRPLPGAALTGLGDPLGDWGAMRAADQEGEAETWREEGRRSREDPGERTRGEILRMERLW